MIRLFNTLVLLLILIALVIIGFANYQPVTLTLLPDELVPFTGFNASIAVPLCIALLAAFGGGFVLGFIWDWIRESKHRREATVNRREKTLLQGELAKLKTETNRHEGKEEILALLDPPRKAG